MNTAKKISYIQAFIAASLVLFSVAVHAENTNLTPEELACWEYGKNEFRKRYHELMGDRYAWMVETQEGRLLRLNRVKEELRLFGKGMWKALFGLEYSPVGYTYELKELFNLTKLALNETNKSFSWPLSSDEANSLYVEEQALAGLVQGNMNTIGFAQNKGFCWPLSPDVEQVLYQIELDYNNPRSSVEHTPCQTATCPPAPKKPRLYYQIHSGDHLNS